MRFYVTQAYLEYTMFPFVGGWMTINRYNQEFNEKV